MDLSLTSSGKEGIVRNTECEICKSKNFKYSCPRCNIKYCSLDCYRSEIHSQCSEAFYKECVVNELQSQRGSGDDKKNVLEMLLRVENEEHDDDEEINEDEEEYLDSDDEEDENDLAERLAEVDLNNADQVWEKLTDAEKQEFKSIVHKGEIETIVKSVEPWWKSKLDEKPVVDIEENKKTLNNIIANCPVILSDIKNFHKISTKLPAKCVIYNVANIVGSYCFIFHLYNGDFFSYELEATNNFISICDNLKSNANFESIVTVIDSIIMNCHNHNLFADLSTKALIYEDLRDIFSGPDNNSNQFLLSALSDVINLFEQARTKYREKKMKTRASSSKGFSKEFPSNSENIDIFTELKNQTHFVGCLKKLEFYLSFLKHCYNKNEWPVEF